MKPNSNLITIDDNLTKIRTFIDEVIIAPKHKLSLWAQITKQTPAAKIGYIGQHLTSLITGMPGTGSGARGDDLADGSEVKSCNKVDQVDKCKECNSRVLRLERICPECGSKNIDRKDDSKWLFSIRDEHELQQYMNLERVVLLLMDYPKFDEDNFDDIRISVFEIYPKEERMSVFNELISNHYYNIFVPKQNENKKTNPMNLHPWGIQFYKCNPIKTFECVIENIDTNPNIIINNYVEPTRERDISFAPVPMPSSLLRQNEWEELLGKADFESEIAPFLDGNYLSQRECREPFCKLSKLQFSQLTIKDKRLALPYLDEKLRNYISLRPINSVTHQEHYQRG